MAGLQPSVDPRSRGRLHAIILNQSHAATLESGENEENTKLNPETARSGDFHVSKASASIGL